MINNQYLDYDHLGERLVDAVPELQSKYDELLKWWENERPGQHIVYGDILNPFLIEKLQAGEDEPLARIFAFLEALASDDNQQIQNVVQVTVCENLSGNHPDLVPLALQYMGPHTQRLSREIAELLGHPFRTSS